MVLKLEGVRKSFRMATGRLVALEGIDLDVPRGQLFVLLGPSGCGKTTLLRTIAGLERPDDGSIRIDGETVFSARERVAVPPERRPIAMVFQSYAVWPHMSVYENVAFPLREGLRPLPARELRGRVDETLDLLELSDMADRSVTSLSGGQQQRVALARALALRPKVLLMDEPLSNLDFKLQVQLRGDIRELVRLFDLTTIYVTHNQIEAMEIGDRIAVLDHGKIVQRGAPREIYRYPEDEFVARFIGEMSLLPARIASRAGEHALLDTAAGAMRARAPRNGAVGDACLLGIRPEDVVLAEQYPTSEHNLIAGDILRSRFVGEAVMYTVRVGAAELTFKAHPRVELADGTRVRLSVAACDCVTVMPRDQPAPYAAAGALADGG
jgi:iron(III) transport system ATP-binding protein